MKDWNWVGWVIAFGALAFSVLTWLRQGHGNRLAEKGEDRATERTHFAWRWHWQKPGEMAVYNAGRSRALNVTISVMVDNLAEVVTDVDEMVQDVPVQIDVPFVRELLAQDRADKQSRAHNALLAAVRFDARHTTRVRILWTTEAGTPREERHDQLMDSLEP